MKYKTSKKAIVNGSVNVRCAMKKTILEWVVYPLIFAFAVNLPLFAILFGWV